MRRLWVAAAALLLTGCSGTVSGVASVNSQDVQAYEQERTPLTSQLAFGDLSTVDYCSLLDLDRVKAAGGNVLDEVQQGFNFCQVPGRVYGQDITVGLGYVSAQGSGPDRVTDPAKQLSRGLAAQRATSNDNKSCTYYLVFADGVSMQIYVQNESQYPSTTAGQSLCAVAGAVVDGAVAKISAGQVGRFSFAPGSLGTVDGCTLLSAAEVDAQLGPLQQTPAMPSKHRCRWQDAAGNQLDLVLDLSDGTGSTAEQIGGHATDVSPIDEAGRDCMATGSVAPHGEQFEVATLYVNASAPPKDACAVARTLAATAWPRLPSS